MKRTIELHRFLIVSLVYREKIFQASIKQIWTPNYQVKLLIKQYLRRVIIKIHISLQTAPHDI